MEIVLNKKEINEGIQKIANTINEKHKNDPTPILMVCVLRGGFMFFSDLLKKIKVDIEIDFLRCSSYRGRYQIKKVGVSQGIWESPDKKHIYIVDDILDSGNTMKSIVEYLNQPLRDGTETDIKSINTITVIYKQNVDFPDTLRIFDVENLDDWYIGYGMDDDKGFNRNLEEIYKL